MVPKILQDDPSKAKQEITWSVQFSNNGDWEKSVAKLAQDATSCKYQDVNNG